MLLPRGCAYLKKNKIELPDKKAYNQTSSGKWGKTMFTNQKLKQLIIPLVIEQILAVLVGMADIMMVSSVSEAAVSGVSLVDSISILIINIFAALATGGAVRRGAVSRPAGRRTGVLLGETADPVHDGDFRGDHGDVSDFRPAADCADLRQGGSGGACQRADLPVYHVDVLSVYRVV